jgi:abequosyltransferase
MAPQSPEISVCIPTYNRAGDLKNCLVRLIAEIDRLNTNAVEIIVSDNASQDGTKEYVEMLAAKYPFIKYYRNSRNLGFGRNMNQAVNYATGSYFWLMGSDDRIVAGSLAKVLDALKSQVDILIGYPVTKGVERQYFDVQPGYIFDVRNTRGFGDFIAGCREVSAAFAFISTIIVKRDFWHSVTQPEYEYTHDYTHMIRLCKGLMEGGRILCLGISIVGSTYNENEWNTSVLRHMSLDLDTFLYVVDELYHADAWVCDAYSNPFTRQYGFLKVLQARIECPPGEWKRISAQLARFNYPSAWIEKSWIDPHFFWCYSIFLRIRKGLRTFLFGPRSPSIKDVDCA